MENNQNKSVLPKFNVDEIRQKMGESAAAAFQELQNGLAQIAVDATSNKPFETPRIHTAREQKVHDMLDNLVFKPYGAVKDKAVPATINGTKTAVVKSRSFLGGLIRKLGEKIEPKK